MNSAAYLLAWRSLWDQPRRALALLCGYSAGVAVMIALLSVGDALLAQARDRDLAAGGDIVLLPEGVDPAVLKVNGVTDLYFAIQQAAYVTREVLRGPRFGSAVAAAAPQLEGHQVYVRSRGRVFPALASAGIPSLDRAAHAATEVPGAQDTAADRSWIEPSSGELLDRLDRFHVPTSAARPTWAEWDYFNFIDPAGGMYGYLTLLAGGQGRGGAILRIKRRGRPVKDVTISATLRPGDLAFGSADQRVGPARVQNAGGRYHITITDPRARVDLWLTPEPGYYLPPGESVAGGVVSGYVVPVLRGWMSGVIRTSDGMVRLDHAPAYHDHNWGTWRGVTWEWGEGSGEGGAVLYGGLHVATAQPRGAERPQVLFIWQPSREDGHAGGGFLGAFPVQAIRYAGWHPGLLVAGIPIRVPSIATVDAGVGADRVRLRLSVQDVLASAATQTGPSALPSARASAAPAAAFLQMRGNMEVRGTVDGRPVAFSGRAAAETFVTIRH
jgi:hypothetical protein